LTLRQELTGWQQTALKRHLSQPEAFEEKIPTGLEMEIGTNSRTAPQKSETRNGYIHQMINDACCFNFGFDTYIM